MMDCEAVDALLDSWEAGVELTEGELDALVSHIGSCSSCGAARAPLVGLLRLDTASDARPENESPSKAAVSLADAVMGRIQSESLLPSGPRRVAPPSPRPSSERRGRYRLALPIAAAAILAVGIGIGAYLGLRDTETVTVRFVLDAPGASTVALAGDFTDWKSEHWQLKRGSADGEWELTLRLRKGGLYAYNFVIDGERWIPDPTIPERVDDGFGGSSSLLRL